MASSSDSARAEQGPTSRTNNAAYADDKDVALQFVGDHAQATDPEVERRVVRKIDLFLIPAMLTGYGLVYYDKAILGSAALFGMTADLHLTTTRAGPGGPVADTSRLSWATSLFYAGMLAGAYPAALALQRLRRARVLCVVVVLWGGICMATAGVGGYRGLYAQRFVLGFCESVVPTGFMVVVGGFYTQREQALRQSVWFSATGLFTVVGSALNYGFAQVEGGGLRGWQYIYLLAGGLTVVFGAWCAVVPDSPGKAWFLDEEEKRTAVERLRRGQMGVRCRKIKGEQVREAVLDVKLWLIAVMMASAYTINGAVSGFGPLIVSTFGYTSLQSILLQFPLGLLCFVSILASGYLSTRFNSVRIPILLLNTLPVIAGCAIIWKSSWKPPRPVGPVVGYTLIGTFGAVVSQVIVVGMANVAGATKKSVFSAAIFIAYCVGNIVGPQLVKSETKAQHYPELWTGLIICYCITIAATVALWYVLWKENRRRDANVDGRAGESGIDEERDKLAFRDLTDKQNPYFRYVW